MGIRKYTWVKFPNHQWVSMFDLTPNRPYRVMAIRENGSAIEIKNDKGMICSAKMNSAKQCTPDESFLARLFE